MVHIVAVTMSLVTLSGPQLSGTSPRYKVKNQQSLSFSLSFNLGKFIKPFKSSVFYSVKWI